MLVNTPKNLRADGSEGAETQAVIRRRFRGAQSPGELQRPRPGDILPSFSGNPVPTKWDESHSEFAGCARPHGFAIPYAGGG